MTAPPTILQDIVNALPLINLAIGGVLALLHVSNRVKISAALPAIEDTAMQLATVAAQAAHTAAKTDTALVPGSAVLIKPTKGNTP